MLSFVLICILIGGLLGCALGWWLTEPVRTQKLLDEFKARFPDQCPICSYYRYGHSHGHTTDFPPLHDCIERAEVANG